MCFFEDVLVLKQEISHLLDFDQVAYKIYHENIEDNFSLKI